MVPAPQESTGDASPLSPQPAVRRWLHRCVPSHFNDPLGLARRLVQSNDRAAWFAMGSAIATAVCWPVDLTLNRWERRLYKQAKPQQRPLIVVCGAPRSGTTVVYQTLVRHLQAAYFSNLTSLFPRSPLTALRLFGKRTTTPQTTLHSFYGRTSGLDGTNDALYLWDRWLGKDRNHPAAELSFGGRTAMQQFFAAATEFFGRPIINKNNSLNASAHLIAEAIDHAFFICLTRDAQQLAESLYRARCDIHGDPSLPYGIVHGESATADCHALNAVSNEVRSVCEQARYFSRLAAEQQRRIGPARFWIVDYEEFCRRPERLVVDVAEKLMGSHDAVRGPLPLPLTPSKRQRVDPAVAAEISACLDALDLQCAGSK